MLLIHGEKAHSRYFSETAFEQMTGIKVTKKAADNAPAPQQTAYTSTVTGNKELMIIANAVHTDLYDGGDNNYIPFDKLENFFKTNLK